MNDFASRLTTALRDEAQELEMSVDMNRAAERLDTRLDGAERSRRRTRWIAVAAALVIAAGALAFATSLRPQPTPPAVVPDGSVTFSDTTFDFPFTMDRPAWLASGRTEVKRAGAFTYLDHCVDGPSTCGAVSVAHMTDLLAYPPRTFTYATYLEHLRALDEQGTIKVATTRDTTVDGHKAIEVSARSLAAGAAALGCNATACQDVEPGMQVRYVVIDMGDGKAPVVLWAQVSESNPDVTEWLQQFERTVESFRFTG